MSSEQPGRRPRWEDRIVMGDGFAYVPGHLLVRGEAAERRAESLTGRAPEDREDLRVDPGAPPWRRVTGVPDPLAVAGVLRSEGLDAQPEHVFFAHGCCSCCGPASEGSGTLAANPFRPNLPLLTASPFRPNPFRPNQAPLSSAAPAHDRELPARPALQGPGRPPRVVVLDTGLAEGTQLPAFLDAPPRISGATDLPDDAIVPAGGGPAFPADGYLDPVAGHGTFIAGIVEQLAGGCEIRVERLIGPLGDGRELDVVATLEAETSRSSAERPDIVCMSFGGPVMHHAAALHTAVAAASLAGIVLVASAGNDGVCTPCFPAAYAEVVGVGALGPGGAPPWTNHGDWVDACAPGVELVSSFFADFDGDFPLMNTVDVDRFAGWATWSGTSFAAPVVVAALAREMVTGDCDAAEAVARVVRAPHLARVPGLGTVVNL